MIIILQLHAGQGTKGLLCREVLWKLLEMWVLGRLGADTVRGQPLGHGTTQLGSMEVPVFPKFTWLSHDWHVSLGWVWLL